MKIIRHLFALWSLIVIFAPCISAQTVDADHDAIPDDYELYFDLDPSRNMDATLDYDDDGLSNLQESMLLTDPFCADTDRDGMFDGMDSVPISRAFMDWGAPEFTAGDYYDYARPDWCRAAYKIGGEWAVNPLTGQSAWHVSAAHPDMAALAIEINRDYLTNNLVYALCLWDHQNASLYLDLLDAEGVVIAEDLYDNLLTGKNMESTLLLDIPTADLPEASIIYLRRGFGQITVFDGLLYIDEDADGLDADQERQLGTSDYHAAGHGDGNGISGCGGYLGQYESAGFKPNGNEASAADKSHKLAAEESTGKIIYVDQAAGDDAFTGRACTVRKGQNAFNHGPKKTVSAGMAAAALADTMVIKTGVYNENLDISGKNINVIIEGNVKL